MGLFITVFVIVFLVMFVIGFIVTAACNDDNDNVNFKQALSFGLGLSIVCVIITTLIMGTVILNRHTTASVRVAEYNAEAEVLEYQLEQIANGEYIIEENEAYARVREYNTEVAILHAKTNNPFYSWFYPDEYLQIVKIEIPE